MTTQHPSKHGQGDGTRRYLIPGLERGLKLLLAFSRENKEMSFADLNRLVDMPRATAYRAIQTLEYMGFLQKHEITGLYSLGINVLSLGFEYIASLDVVQLGQPLIERLRDETQSSSHIAIRDGQDVIYVARVSAPNSKVNEVSVGTRLPAHCTSLGRMLLTDLDRQAFEALYPSTELPPGPHGICRDREGLWALVQEDRTRGYVIGESFFRLGISSIVSPIFDREGRVEAVVSIMVPSHEIPPDRRQPLYSAVSKAAQEISSFMGWAGARGQQKSRGF